MSPTFYNTLNKGLDEVKQLWIDVPKEKIMKSDELAIVSHWILASSCGSILLIISITWWLKPSNKKT